MPKIGLSKTFDSKYLIDCPSKDMSMQITVIGGTRGLGNWIASYLKKKGGEVTITGRNNLLGESVAKKLGVKYTPNNIKAAANSDVTILAVPIDVTPRTIKEISPHLPVGSLLMDVTSVKEKPAQVMQEYVPEGVEFLPMHPVFGPRIRSLDGQVVVLTPVTKGKWYKKVVDFLEGENTRIIEATPRLHDQMMSVVQGLTHLTYISMAATLEKLEVDVGESRKFASPIYSLMLDMIARITAQNPYLYYSIQASNYYIPRTHDVFLSTYRELYEMIEKGDEDGFVKIMSKAAKHMGDLESALGRSDKAISALNQELNVLKNSIGREVGLRHIYSDQVHIGILEDLSADFAVLKSKNKEIQLKVSNIEILTGEEMEEYKRDNYPHKSLDVSVILPETSDPELVAQTIQGFSGVMETSVLDVYHSSQIGEGMKSITLRYEVIDLHVKEKVEELLKGFGGIIR